MLMQPQMYVPQSRGFPRQTFKGMAGTTITIGILCILVGVAEICYSGASMNNCMQWQDRAYMEMDDEVYPEHKRVFKRSSGFFDHDNKRNHRDSSDDDDDSHDSREKHMRMFWHDEEDDEHKCQVIAAIYAMAAFTYSGCGMVFIVTGALGVGAARTMLGHRQSGLKTGFIVLNILIILGFAPTVFVLGLGTAVLPGILASEQGFEYYAGHAVTGSIIGLLGATMSILSLVAASVSCCCAPVTEEIKVITMASPVTPPNYTTNTPAQLQVDEKAELVKNEALA